MVWSDVLSTSPGASRLLCILSALECCVQKGTIQDVEVRCYLILTRFQWGRSTIWSMRSLSSVLGASYPS